MTRLPCDVQTRTHAYRHSYTSLFPHLSEKRIFLIEISYKSVSYNVVYGYIHATHTYLQIDRRTCFSLHLQNPLTSLSWS